MSTIQQVDPIALRQKLKRLGIGPGSPMSQGNSESAIQEFTMSQTLPTRDPRVPREVLEPSELAYCIHNWSMLWEVPG